MRNLTASHQTKIKQLAKEESKIVDKIFYRYIHEGVLFRLVRSPHKDNLLLKGGTLLYAVQQHINRPTSDIDFLGVSIKNDVALCQAMFKEILAIESDQDALLFDFDTMRAEVMNENERYEGVRLYVDAKLGNMTQILKIEIGFGDVVTPSPIEMSYPSMFAEAIPAVKAYNLETVIAEKFEAMMDLGDRNSRWKDFYDLYKILSQPDYDAIILGEAIRKTFQTRKTLLDKDNVIFTTSFANSSDRAKAWNNFLIKNKLDTSLTFETVMNVIKSTLQPYAEG
ncbi:MAG: nucleotidyl transferase AbiEii/AbiGii toxin family protein [Bacteroidetes bacterium]|nr:MAG: nucleotidyl transferase AbiEii/AbiGii toxin family protein [Bacteroidota bacterium]